MKSNLKKISAFVLALVMMLAMTTTAFAQEVGSKAEGTATITVNNASKGETYAVYKLFDASVTGTEDGSIAYTGDIPASLQAFFAKDTAGNISETAAARAADQSMSDGLKAALAAWVKDQTAIAEVESDGSTLNFNGLAYGYYVVTTTQGQQAITVTSTNPNATIIDKNTTTPVVDPEGKKVDDDDVYIGQTLTYILKFTTANYDGEKKIISYTAKDTLPDFLDSVTVTGIVLSGDGDLATTDDNTALTTQQFGTDGTIVIPWVDAEGNSLYKNGSTLFITYTAVVTDQAAIAGDGNANTFTLTYTTTEGEGEPDQNTSTETVKTYALAIQKVDDKGAPLTGAKFSVKGLQTTLETDANGNAVAGTYIVTGLTAEGGTDTEMEVGADGVLIIKGVASGEYEVTETGAPAGYNKLTAPVKVQAVVTNETTTTTTTYLDENGNVTDEVTDIQVTYENSSLAASVTVVVNMTGSLLPSTGGIGTTIFYVVGGVLVIGACVMLVTKKRMSHQE